MNPWISVTESPEETLELAGRVWDRHRDARAFYLEGDLGAGKTMFTKGLAGRLGIAAAEVTSPTFALVERHGGGVRPFYHLDLYRIQHPAELDELGIEEMEEEEAVVVVEWPEKLGRFRRDDAVRVRIRNLGPNRRSFEIERAEARE